MQRTADFYHQITDAHLPEASGLTDDAAAALDAAVEVLDAYATAGDAPIRRLVPL